MTEEMDAAKMLNELIGFIENLGMITDAAKSFRQQLETEGYSPTMAEHIAGELHVLMLRRIFEGKS